MQLNYHNWRPNFCSIFKLNQKNLKLKFVTHFQKMRVSLSFKLMWIIQFIHFIILFLEMSINYLAYQGWMPLTYLATNFSRWGQLPVTCRFYYLKVSSNDSSLKSFSTFKKKKLPCSLKSNLIHFLNLWTLGFHKIWTAYDTNYTT